VPRARMVFGDSERGLAGSTLANGAWSEELVAEAGPTYAAARRRWLVGLDGIRTAVLAAW